jgi:rubrerythrin
VDQKERPVVPLYENHDNFSELTAFETNKKKGDPRCLNLGIPFPEQPFDRKLTHAELVRTIRFMVAAEYEAVQLYMQAAESTDNELAKAVLKDIAEEEIVHAGEFLRLLKELDPEEDAYYREGAEEVEEIIQKLKK